jgi:hypothetical protein
MPLSTINSNSIANGTVIAADILDGTISSSKLVAANIAGDRIAANTLSNTVFQTGSVENYMRTNTLDFGMRNRLINGAMTIDQRNAGASGTSTGYTVDRWQYLATQSAKGTWQQNRDGGTPPAGFTNYLGFTSSSAYSVTGTDYFYINQNVEGFNWADLRWGTANARPVTLSFWVRSSLTGTFGGSLVNWAGNYSHPFSYTIVAANTWEQKFITVVGPTAGTWPGATNAGALQLYFSLGTGSTYSGTAGSWSANYYGSATGAVSVVGTNAATWYVTGVQLEEGSVPTAFEYRQYGAELNLCLRYYALSSGASGIWYNSQNFRVIDPFKVLMRVTPTIALNGDGSGVYHEAWNQAGYTGVSSINVAASSPRYADVQFVSSADRGRTYGAPAMVVGDVLTYSSEL